VLLVTLLITGATSGAMAIDDVDFSNAEEEGAIGLEGTELIVFLVVAIQMIQVPLALFMRYVAGQRTMRANLWFLLGLVPIFGFITFFAFGIAIRNSSPTGEMEVKGAEAPRRTS
jgi:hypothetical protein